MEQKHISWESHLFGAMVGTVFAFLWRNIGPQKKKFYWHKSEKLRQEDEELWQRYLEKYPEEEKPPKQSKPPFKDMF